MPLETMISRILLTIALGAFIGLGRDYNLSPDLAKDKDKERKKIREIKSAEAKKKFSFIDSSVPASGLGGLRTYILIALLGAISGVAASIGMNFIALLFGGAIILFLIVSFVLNYFDKNTFGLTTEVSILLTFVLSFLMLTSDIDVRLLISLFIINALVLSIKTETKALVSKFSRKEVVDTAKFALFAIVIWQFLPNVNYTLAEIPYVGPVFTEILGSNFTYAMDFFNPNRLWLIVVLISGMNFIGYFLIKVLGRNRGLNILGLLGGFVSSTTVTQAFALLTKNLKSKEQTDNYVSAVLLANFVSFVRILFITAIINLSFVVHIFWPITVMGLVILVYFYKLRIENGYLSFMGISHSKSKNTFRKDQSIKDGATKSLKRLGISFDSPFSFKPALVFGFIFLGVIIFTNVGLYYLGDGGFVISSIISAVSGLDAITINTANFAGTGNVAYNVAAMVLVASASVNLLVKGVFAAMISNKYFRKEILKIFIVATAMSMGVYFLTII